MSKENGEHREWLSPTVLKVIGGVLCAVIVAVTGVIWSEIRDNRLSISHNWQVHTQNSTRLSVLESRQRELGEALGKLAESDLDKIKLINTFFEMNKREAVLDRTEVPTAAMLETIDRLWLEFSELRQEINLTKSKISEVATEFQKKYGEGKAE